MGVRIETVDGQGFNLPADNFSDFKAKFIGSLGVAGAFIAGDHYVINVQHVVSITETDD